MFSVRFISVFLVNGRKFGSSACIPHQLTFFANATAQSAAVEKLGPDATPCQVIHAELLFKLTITHCFGQEHIHFP